MATNMKNQRLAQEPNQSSSNSFCICEARQKTLFYHIQKNFISRLQPETQTMDGICSVPHAYGIQMKFNNPAAQGQKQ